ncbi:MAG TPA: hemerythrin domain-containing protein [Candidatus Limnocylindrales bacterium]|nr:hemerythrin domain-containing protein [Candidatus Limnocylindrales bacterium]
MSTSLPQVAHERHDHIVAGVDRLPAAADRLLASPGPEAVAALEETASFLDRELLPHIEIAETALYPELERMYQNRHSMAPMRREHAEIRRLVGVLSAMTEDARGKGLSLGRVLAIRRVLFTLYAMLKIHLAEEEAYLRVIEHGVTEDVADLIAATMAVASVDAG